MKNSVISSGFIMLAVAMSLFAQEQIPVFDAAFGLKSFGITPEVGYDDIIGFEQGPAGGFYISGNQSLTKLGADGTELWSMPYSESVWLYSLGGLFVDNEDNAYVAASSFYEHMAWILKYDPAGVAARMLEFPIAPSSLPVALSLTGNRDDGRIYVAAEYYDDISFQSMIFIGCYDKDLVFISSSVFAGTTWGIGGISTDRTGNVYYTGLSPDYRHIVKKYAPGLSRVEWEFFRAEDYGGEHLVAAAAEGGVAVGYEDYVAFISSEGAQKWRVPAPGYYLWDGLGVDGGGNVYIGDSMGPPDYYGALSKLKNINGNVLWTLSEQNGWDFYKVLVDGQDRIYVIGELRDSTGKDFYMARYLQGGDTTAPAEASDLAVTTVSSNSITVAWTAPGDDGESGTAAAYDLRYAVSGAITTDEVFTAASRAEGVPAPQAAGTPETFTVTGLLPGTTYFFGIKTADEAGNVSGLSNSPQGATAAVPAEKYSLRKYAPPEPHIVTVNAWSAPLVSRVNISGTTNPAREIAVSFSVSTYPSGAEGFFLSKSSEATNAQGLADVLLKLGNIPAEYGVTATCNNCEASASTATFTCCGKLPNDDFKQSDLSWGTTHYDNICSTEPPNTGNYKPVYTCSAPIFNNPQYQKYKFTVRAKGCALSSLATLINFYKETYDLTVSSTTPLLLNVFLGNNVASGTNCYSKQGAVSFECVKKYSSNIKFSEKSDIEEIERADLVKAATEDVHKGAPVILKISNPTHFVLAIGKCGNKFIVSDPGSSASENILYNPEGARPLIGIRRFKYSE